MSCPCTSPPVIQDPPLLVASFAPSGELIVAGTDDKSTEVTVHHNMTSVGGLRLLWLHFVRRSKCGP